MLDHLIDFGMPIIPSIDVLSKIIKKPTFTQKLKETFSSKFFFIFTKKAKSKSLTEDLEQLVISLENKSPLDAALMWKDTTSKDAQNACLFEVVEHLECVLDNEGTIVDSKIEGTVFTNCSVPGSAEVSATFKSTFPYSDYSLHRDIILANSVEQFKNMGTLRFYPSGVSTELMRYTVENPPIALPFNISYDLVSKSDYLTLNISVSPVMVQGDYLKVNNFTVNLYMPKAFSSQSLSAKNSVFLFNEKESVFFHSN